MTIVSKTFGTFFRDLRDGRLLIIFAENEHVHTNFIGTHSQSIECMYFFEEPCMPLNCLKLTGPSTVFLKSSRGVFSEAADSDVNKTEVR